MQFEGTNQFDNKFKNIGKFGDDRNACPLFALFTAYNFMKNGDVSQHQHDTNIETSILNYITHEELPKYMSFDELICFFKQFKDTEVQATTPELINEYGYENIFDPEAVHNYSVILLKNSNFIAVLVHVSDDGSMKFYVRDCHEREQYMYNNQADLYNHLKNNYQFQELTIVVM